MRRRPQFLLHGDDDVLDRDMGFGVAGNERAGLDFDIDDLPPGKGVTNAIGYVYGEQKFQSAILLRPQPIK